MRNDCRLGSKYFASWLPTVGARLLSYGNKLVCLQCIVGKESDKEEVLMRLQLRSLFSWALARMLGSGILADCPIRVLGLSCYVAVSCPGVGTCQPDCA